MSRRTDSGFTMVELIIALVLFGIVGISIYKLLVSNQRLYYQQTERVNTNQAARAAASILPMEIRELDATDPSGGSDILTASSTGFRYRAMKSVYFACADGAGTSVIVDRSRWFGIRAADVTTDSLLIFAEGDESTRSDDAWLHANVTAMSSGTACSDGSASITFTVALASGSISSVLEGAPVRSYQDEQVSLYQDASGDYWLGSQTISKSSGSTSTIQPIVGPLTSSGLALAYYDTTGTVTADRTKIARIAISVTAQSHDPVYGSTGIGYLTQSLATDVALRNNRRY